MSMKAAIKNAALTAGVVSPPISNAPPQCAGKQHQYFARETSAFVVQNLRYASDFVTARVQGLEMNDPNGWGEYRLRMADVVRPSAAILRRFDDYKQVLFEDPRIDYLRPGTKMEALGSYWLAINPQNLSTAGASGIVQRCNAVWNHLDFYGNVVSEPIIVENARADANDSDYQAGGLVTKGYFNIICQYNDFTAQIDTNTRVILGKGAWRVTGYADFRQEFTGDYGSVRMLEFTVRFEEPNAEIDDMENHVAGGRTFEWSITLSGVSELTVGQTVQFLASSARIGESVEGTAERPVSYLWSSSDESVATVDAFGIVTAVTEGSTLITATLDQNHNIFSDFSIFVRAAGQTGVSFTSSVPESIEAYTDAVITAAYFKNGAETDEALIWEFSGADKSAYSVVAEPKSSTIYCFGYSSVPLVVTARCGECSASAEIRLGGI